MNPARHDRESIGEAAAENPGRAALLSFVTTPLALKTGRLALRWARRNPGLAMVVAAGALVWWGTRAMRDGASTGASSRGAADTDDSFDFPGAAHGSVPGYGSREDRGPRGGGSARYAGGDDSTASSL